MLNIISGKMCYTFGDILTTCNMTTSRKYSVSKQLDAIFQCQACGRVYKSKTALKLHERVECGKEPQLQCCCCQKMFYHNGNLNRHLKFVHKVTL